MGGNGKKSIELVKIRDNNGSGKGEGWLNWRYVWRKK